MPITVGAIVLAVGVQPETPQSETMLKAAARARAAAVVFKGRDEVAALAGDSASFGVALLSVPEEMTWTQLHGRAPAALRRERGVARAAAPAR